MIVGAGEIVGLLGPNGAGKTTSFYMIVGLIKQDAGKITLVTMTSLKLRCMAGQKQVSVTYLRSFSIQKT